MTKCRLIVMFAALLMGVLTASAQITHWFVDDVAKKQKKDPNCGCETKPKEGLIDSHIRFNDFWGEVKMRPNWEEDDSYEFVDLDSPIYECYRIKTEEESGAILGLEDMSTYVIKEESTLIIKTEDANISKFELIFGTMWANIKKMAAGKSLDVEMAQCVLGVEGTIFAVEQKNGVSKVWLFAGKTNVKSKKTGKKTVMSPGQTVSVGKDGVAKVQKFDIEQGAKKFGIKMEDIRNHYSKTPSTKTDKDKSTTSVKRYNVKSAIVKYKFSQGKATGTMERIFDDYGAKERRHTSIKNPTKETIMYHLGDKIYDVDAKTKTVKVSDNNELYFIDPNNVKFKKLQKKGTATVLGKPCTVYHSNRTDYYVWNGIMLKKIVRPEKGLEAITEATSIQTPASIQASELEIPKGYTVKK